MEAVSFSFSLVSFKAPKLYNRLKRTQMQSLHPMYIYSMCRIWYPNITAIHGKQVIQQKKLYLFSGVPF